MSGIVSLPRSSYISTHPCSLSYEPTRFSEFDATRCDVGAGAAWDVDAAVTNRSIIQKKSMFAFYNGLDT